MKMPKRRSGWFFSPVDQASVMTVERVEELWGSRRLVGTLSEFKPHLHADSNERNFKCLRVTEVAQSKV